MFASFDQTLITYTRFCTFCYCASLLLCLCAFLQRLCRHASSNSSPSDRLRCRTCPRQRRASSRNRRNWAIWHMPCTFDHICYRPTACLLQPGLRISRSDPQLLRRRNCHHSKCPYDTHSKHIHHHNNCAGDNHHHHSSRNKRCLRHSHNYPATTGHSTAYSLHYRHYWSRWTENDCDFNTADPHARRRHSSWNRGYQHSNRESHPSGHRPRWSGLQGQA
jgi:hypothetical protein